MSSTDPMPAAGDLVYGLMPDSDRLNTAIKALENSGFDRADLSLPEIDPPAERATPEAGTAEADTDVEAQQSRLVHSAVGGSFAAMMAATATAATGGVAAAVAGAAIGTGLAVGAAANAISRWASNEEQKERDRRAIEGKLVSPFALRTQSGGTVRWRSCVLQVHRGFGSDPNWVAAGSFAGEQPVRCHPSGCC